MTDMQNINTILCATDLSKASGRLLCLGAGLCLRFNAGFRVFHCIPPPRGSLDRQIEFERGREKKEKIKIAQERIKDLMKDFDIHWESVITYGDPVLEAAKVSEKLRADLVIAASHGLSGLQQFFIGSVIGDMAKTIQKPFLVMPPANADTGYQKTGFFNIIIACSLTPSDAHLINYALAFIEKFSSRITLTHVMESPGDEIVMDDLSGNYEDAQKLYEKTLSLRLKSLMPGETKILHGVPGEELALYAKHHGTDLIIAGVDDRPGRIITPTTATLIRQLPCAVLTVPLRG